jgi:hypothetical protein
MAARFRCWIVFADINERIALAGPRILVSDAQNLLGQSFPVHCFNQDPWIYRARDQRRKFNISWNFTRHWEFFSWHTNDAIGYWRKW